MKTIYVLSNRAKKELLIRGAPILLALPAPPVLVDDPLDWAKSVLPADLRADAVEAVEQEVFVQPRRSGEAATLTALLGDIPGPGAKDKWGYWIAAVVVRLQHGEPRQKIPESPQWPADVLIDGVPMMRNPEDT